MVKKINYQIGVGGFEISQKEKEYVNEVLNSNRLSYGPFSKKFENLMASAHGCKTAVLMNSGTSAIRTSVACLKELENWQDNDEILCPAVTFVASSNVIIDRGLKPVFVDVCPKTYNIDPLKIEEKITPKTRAIMVVHLFGQAAEMDPVLDIARKYNLKVIEDACESTFSEYKGKPVGSFGDISCFSTYAAHILTTGVGGLACTNNLKYAEVIRSLANHGRDGIYIGIDDDKGLDKQKLSEVVSRRFRFIRLGYSFRATEMEAAVGLGQFELRDAIVKKRQENADYLINRLKRLEKYIQLPYWPKYKKHTFMMFPIVIKQDTGIKKMDLVMFLEERNIETRDMQPLINQPVYIKLFGSLEPQYPVAKWINQCGFFIGCHQALKKFDLDYISAAFEEYFSRFYEFNER